MTELMQHHAPDVAEPAGDELAELFARWQGELLGTLYYLVGNRDDALDALQESFLKCWRQRHAWNEIENPRAWIFRVVLNTGRDLRQTAWRRRREGLPESELAADPRTDPQLAAVESEQKLSLRAAIARLRPEEAEVFLLRQNGQLSYEDIGHTLNIPIGTAKTRMRLALGRLRAALADP